MDQPSHVLPLQRIGPKAHALNCVRPAVLTAAVALSLLGPSTVRAQINPGIIDPTNSFAGKTYSQLAAGWWQYFMSLPTTNSPLNSIPGNPPVPMSTGQSGPVWFIGGSYSAGGTNSFTNTIPSVGLFLIITGIEKDNANCPPTIYNEPYLRAWAGGTENHAFGMTCTIDGVPISVINDVTTTPYRVQSRFSPRYSATPAPPFTTISAKSGVFAVTRTTPTCLTRSMERLWTGCS